MAKFQLLDFLQEIDKTWDQRTHEAQSHTITSMNSISKGTQVNNDDNLTAEKLLFFNYHEYSVKNYRKVDCGYEDIHTQALIVTHFPNPYATKDSVLFQTTRIVRIPRTFESIGTSIPQFSNRLPGTESAAIIDDDGPGMFTVKGEYKDQLFGTSSFSPLSLYLSEDEFRGLVDSVNERLRDVYNFWTLSNVTLFFLDLLCLWLVSECIDSLSKRVRDYLLMFYGHILTPNSEAE